MIFIHDQALGGVRVKAYLKQIMLCQKPLFNKLLKKYVLDTLYANTKKSLLCFGNTIYWWAHPDISNLKPNRFLIRMHISYLHP